MPCTTILVGKNASNNGSTLVARNDDSPTGVFHSKKMVVVSPSKQPRHYLSKISKVKIELPDNPLSYTACPNVDLKEGLWLAAGINSKNVAMSATETITSNPRVLGADPLGDLKNSKHGEAGIGEEDLVAITLPYIKSAREGVLRLGSLIEKYGTYESNGIAFNDENEIWWLESVGGHNWMAKRVKDDEYVVMPNQLGIDSFDFEDANGEKKENLCSAGLLPLMKENDLDLTLKGSFNPRLAFGSHDDSDHEYNTPRAWFMLRYLNPRTYKWDGPAAEYGPESDDLPWSLVPERKITIEDVKYLLSSYYQGTPFDPYGKGESPLKGKYRPIGISRTSFMAILEIRPNVIKQAQAIEWICFGSNAYNAMMPIFANVSKIPSYLSGTTSTVSTSSFYWASRLLGSLADPYHRQIILAIEDYQDRLVRLGHANIKKTDALLANSKDIAETLETANEEMAKLAQKETDGTLNKVLYLNSCLMKNGFARNDR